MSNFEKFWQFSPSYKCKDREKFRSPVMSFENLPEHEAHSLLLLMTWQSSSFWKVRSFSPIFRLWDCKKLRLTSNELRCHCKHSLCWISKTSSTIKHLNIISPRLLKHWISHLFPDQFRNRHFKSRHPPSLYLLNYMNLATLPGGQKELIDLWKPVVKPFELTKNPCSKNTSLIIRKPERKPGLHSISRKNGYGGNMSRVCHDVDRCKEAVGQLFISENYLSQRKLHHWFFFIRQSQFTCNDFTSMSWNEITIINSFPGNLKKNETTKWLLFANPSSPNIMSPCVESSTNLAERHTPLTSMHRTMEIM